MRPRALVLACLLALSTQVANGAPLQLCYEDVPQQPWTMPDGSGLNFALLKRVEALTGERFVASPRPWARCIEEARVGRMDGIIGAADSPERRLFSVPPLQADGSPDPAKALYLAKAIVFVRANSGASWDGKTLHNPRASIIAQRGYFIGAVLRQRGQRVIDNVKSADEALRLLAAGNADVAVLMTEISEQDLRTDPRFRTLVTRSPLPYMEFPLFLLASRASYEQDPARIEAIWSAIATVRASADYRKLEELELRRRLPAAKAPSDSNSNATLPGSGSARAASN
jgi:polar amino acid transport system substrate-binding protein